MDSINEKGCVIFVSATSTLFDMIFMKMEVWINDILLSVTRGSNGNYLTSDISQVKD